MKFILILLVHWLVCTPCTFAMIDLDADGMSDVWEKKFHAENVAPNADDDFDGSSNMDESLAGTDPFSASSVLAVTSSQYYSSTGVLQWQSIKGASCQLQRSTQLDDWTDVGLPIVGNGGMMTVLDAAAFEERCFYRLKLLGNGGFDELPPLAGSIVGVHDTDRDGIDDLTEIRNGLDAFDPEHSLPEVAYSRGMAMKLTWLSVNGKHYQIQKADSPIGPWQDLNNGIYAGTGAAVTAAVTFDTVFSYIRVVVLDLDQDEDGVTDWEELQVGLDPKVPKTDILGAGDLAELNAMFLAVDTVTVNASRAVANITQMIDGGFKIERHGGMDELSVDYTITGSAIPGNDYIPLSGSAVIPFGSKSVIIPVKPLSNSMLYHSESVILTLQTASNYSLGNKTFQEVNVLKESVINVADYGAVGDGTTDDTGAIQAAIIALEGSSTHNTLYFPEGIYRLNSSIQDSQTHTSYHRVLKLGNQDLANRDIVIRGAGAKLYSTVSPLRAHILEVRGNFRTLHFSEITFEKDTVVLDRPLKLEPNGADGVSLVNVDSREIEMVEFDGCEFINCHGAIGTYGNGYNIRGKLAQFNLLDCNVINLYGANTVNNSSLWGGGQLVNVTPWIGHALYLRNYFDGGSRVATNPQLNPLGRKKDGSHFGGPLRLDFVNNIVESMAVEAVYQLHDPYMGVTKSVFQIPYDDGSDTSAVKVSDHTSSYQAGQIIAVRGVVESGGSSKSVSLEVVSFSLSTKMLILKNTGLNDFDVGGVTFSANHPIYLQGDVATVANITGNIVRPHPVFEGGGQSGIVANANARIHNNIVIGYGTGILVYGNSRTPLSPGGRGTCISSNLITTVDGSANPWSFVYGIHVFDPDIQVRGNTIWTPVSSHVIGIAARGLDAQVAQNLVIAKEVLRNGYDSSLRAVGCGVGNTSLNAVFRENTTYGFDVGVGPIDKYQSIPHYVIDHRSINDVLPIDPRGVIPN